nr:MAG TPA: hypothetical protein [Caudoviricetes sp.]
MIFVSRFCPASKGYRRRAPLLTLRGFFLAWSLSGQANLLI